MNKTATIQLRNLTIGYKGKVRPKIVAENICSDIYAGELTCLLGTNGIGKTTLLKSILGLIPSLSGKCELGENLQIGYFEQEVKGDNRNTCIEEIWEEFPSFTQYEVRSALAKCGLTTKHIESQVRVLSGGEQAKVRLCKLVNRDTNVLLLDEPTNHLDITHQIMLMELVKKLNVTVISAIHDLNIAAAYCDKIYVLKDGVLEGYGTPQEVLTPELIKRIYQVDSEVVNDSRGKMHILFL